MTSVLFPHSWTEHTLGCRHLEQKLWVMNVCTVSLQRCLTTNAFCDIELKLFQVVDVELHRNSLGDDYIPQISSSKGARQSASPTLDAPLSYGRSHNCHDPSVDKGINSHHPYSLYTISMNNNHLFQVLLNQRRGDLQMATEPVWLLVSAHQLGPKPVTGWLWVPTVTQLSSQSQRVVRSSHRVSHQAPPSLLENPSSQSPWAVKLSQVSENTLLWSYFVLCFSLCHVICTVRSLSLTLIYRWCYRFNTFLWAFCSTFSCNN